jgi:ferric-dicitrate binding protein FerR (iron transport regulator)
VRSTARVALGCLLVALSCSLPAPGQRVATIAATEWIHHGDGGPATNSTPGQAESFPVESAGDLSSKRPLLATVRLHKPVLVNGSLVPPPGVAMIDGDRLETNSQATAVLWIVGSDSLVLGQTSALRLRKDKDGVSAELETGRVAVSSGPGRLSEVRLPGDAISIRAVRGAPVHYQVTRLPDATYVYARRGNVSILDEACGKETEVPEGRVGRIAVPVEPAPQAPAPRPAPPSAAGQRAGQITATIPKQYVIRGQHQEDGQVGSVVMWEDLLRTEPRGRVRVVLDDGSILNLGSGSDMRVIRHAVQSQQTELEMRYGRMRAQVVKLARPGSKFEIRTSTAICGVLGTDFYVYATPRETRVVVFKGIVRVTPLAAGAIAGVAAAGRAGRAGAQAGAGQASSTASTTVTAGQATTAVAGSVSAPAAATAAQIQTAIAATQAGTTAATTAAVAGVAAARVGVVAVTAAPAVASASIAAATVLPSPISPSQP